MRFKLDVGEATPNQTGHPVTVQTIVEENVDRRYEGGANFEGTENNIHQSVNLKASFANRIRGKGETVAAEVKFANGEILNGPTSYSLRYSDPLLDRDITGRESAEVVIEKKNDERLLETSEFLLSTLGTRLSYSFNPQNTVTYECAWREVRPTRRANIEIFKQLGHTIKSSLRHTWHHNTTDNLAFPSTGSYFQVENEFAGLLGDVRFFKSEVLAQQHIPVAYLQTLSFSCYAGYMTALSGQRLRVNDKFFLSTRHLRGFNAMGTKYQFRDEVEDQTTLTEAAPRMGNLLGGDLYTTASALYSFPIPGLVQSADLVRGHVYGTVGNLMDVNYGETVGRNLERLANGLRLGVGAGVAFNVNGARFELNYNHPIWEKQGDIKARWQLGVSVCI